MKKLKIAVIGAGSTYTPAKNDLYDMLGANKEYLPQFFKGSKII